MTRTQATLSLVVPVYNVERWLPEFLSSLTSQGGALTATEIIFVIDGATDGSADLIRTWIATQPDIDAKLVEKENGGLPSARNAGMAVASGLWVTFPDPDDVLGEGYLESLTRSIEQSDVDVAVARFLPFFGAPGQATDSHPFRYRFARGSRIVDIDESPRFFPFAVNSAAVRLDAIRSARIVFDDRVSTVEDGVFMAEVLASSKRRRVAFVAEAEYFYRKRDDGTSQLDGAWKRADRYAGALEHGFARVAGEYFAEEKTPRWLQYMMLYDLQWYFKMDLRNDSPTAGLSDEDCAAINRRFDDYLGWISTQTILEFNVTDIPLSIRLAWILRKSGKLADQDVSFTYLDVDRGLVCIRYFTDSPDDGEIVFLDGVPSAPFASKTRAFSYFKEPWLWERIIWVSAMHDVAIQRAGRTDRERVKFGHPGQPIVEATPGHIWSKLRKKPAPYADGARPIRPIPPSATLSARVRRRIRNESSKRRERKWLEYAQTSTAAERYKDAWLLIDRDTAGRDNAESLYRYLAANEPNVNAYFVIDRDSPDFDRLRKDGFRLVAHRSREHFALRYHARHLISSQVDHYILQPFSEKALQKRPRDYTFLQHGVTHNDLSRWLNAKPISLMLAATMQEHSELTRSGGLYTLTTREVVLTGFPRHDELEQLSSKSKRDLILIMPTWRKNLLELVDGQTNKRGVLDGFRESEYFTAWMDVVRSERLRQLAEASGLKIAFAPHPNMQGHIVESDVPDWVELVSYRDSDIKSWIARSRLAVTDYSSLAFEAAYVRSGVVYYQFDRESFFSGGHAFRRGEFSYERDGFGPVVATHDRVIAEIEAAIVDAPKFDQQFGARIEGAFAFRDGNASERTVAAIRALESKVDAEETS